MADIAQLLTLIETGYSGTPWHGPSLRQNLTGVSAVEASRRLGTRHTIWELVLHLAAWRGEIARRLQGHEAGDPPDGDFPPAPTGAAATEDAWQETLARLDRAHTAFMTAARAVPDADLQKPVLDYRENRGGKGATRFVTLAGVAQHDAYHSGQIALLKE